MDYILEFIRSQIGKIILALMGSVIIIGLVYNIFAPTAEERLEQAQTSINALFYEDRDQVLRTDVSQEEINQAQKAVNRLPDSDNENYQPVLDDAVAQFKALQVVSDVFEGNALKSDQAPLIKEGVTQEQLSQIHTQVGTEIAPYVEKVKEQLNQAMKMLPEMDVLKDKIIDFTDQENITRSNLYSVIQQANTMTDDAILYANQPYLASYYSDFTQTMDTLADAILNGYSYGEYEQLTLDEIFVNPILSEQLKGTPLNPLPKVSLTFDDGPNMEYTPQILDILGKYNIKATFFVYGAYVDEYPDMAQRIVDEGHILGNHSYSHPNFSEISDEEVIQQIEWTQESIYDATGYEAFLYRMPFGAGGPRVVNLLSDYTSIIWNLDSLDWHLQDADAIYENVMANMSNDALILMHDTGQYTVDAVARFVPELLEKGYEFVSPMELDFQHRFFAE
ncbi:polysaccharide deacetylase family protein [Aerococcaceae bacterium WGS1372]